MPHATFLKFNYPYTLLHEYQHWAVLLRPKQVTVGSLVLICKEAATRVPDLSAAAFAEMQVVTRDLEATLHQVFAFDKINYLCLMMVDPQVHFHVLPRYAHPRSLTGKDYSDPFWPGPPDVTKALDLTDEQFASLLELLKSRWPQ
jgi:diadenosine tetraphosphate (Ap4A) HIT family hydrolase